MHADEASVLLLLLFSFDDAQHNSCLFGLPWRTAHCKHHLLLQTNSWVCDFHIDGQGLGECGQEPLTEKISLSERKTLCGQLRVTLKGYTESPWLSSTCWFTSITTFLHSLRYCGLCGSCCLKSGSQVINIGRWSVELVRSFGWWWRTGRTLWEDVQVINKITHVQATREEPWMKPPITTEQKKKRKFEKNYTSGLWL